MEGLWLGLCLLLLTVQGCDKPPTGPEVSTSGSAIQTINDRIGVGKGPVLGWEDLLLEVYPEKVWLTGAEVSVQNANGGEEYSHLLDLLTVGWTYPEEHGRRFYDGRTVSPVFFRFSHPTRSVHLPDGYGIPLWSNEPISLRVRWRNLDLYQKDVEVKAVVRLHFVRDRVLQQPLVPVLPGDIFTAAPVHGQYQYNSREPWREAPAGLAEGSEVFADGYRQDFTQDWLVEEEQNEVSFRLTGLQPHLPGGRIVYSTGYAYPPTREIDLRVGATEISLSPESFASGEILELKDSEEIVLRVAQDPSQLNRLNLARMLVYFEDSRWNGFPEMLQ